MRDPHVTRLHYKLAAERTLIFSAPPPVERKLAGFTVRLDHNEAEVTMIDHYADQASARAAVEPYLLAWSLRWAVTQGKGRDEFRFEFDRADVVDRAPETSGNVALVGSSMAISEAVITEVTLTLTRYPDPPDDFAASLDVQTLWLRYAAYSAGRESLLTMMYFCLTVLEARCGGGRRARQRAAQALAVDLTILDRIGEMAANEGDATQARKRSTSSSLRPLTNEDISWCERAMLALIRRVGECDADPTVTRTLITPSDLA